MCCHIDIPTTNEPLHTPSDPSSHVPPVSKLMKRPIEIDDSSFTSKRPKVIEQTSSLTSIHKGQTSKHLNLCHSMSEQHAKERNKLVSIQSCDYIL